jgi:glycosyltransferase domain-containing protein
MAERLATARPLMRRSVAYLDDYTLIIPTYNRSGDLARLLRYLERHDADFRILVLDSSSDEMKQRNEVTIGRSALHLRHELLDASIHPFEKFRLGATLVETEFCSLCADDDLVLPQSLSEIVSALRDDRTHAVAHGWYFTFYLTDHFGITSIVYRGESIDSESALLRVRQLLKTYEALTYGVHRTDILRTVLDEVRGLDSILFREVGAGVLTVARGKSLRVPVLYYGRSLGPSANYAEWHPLEFLARSPGRLFTEYMTFRKILIEVLSRGPEGGIPRGELEPLLDLFHLRYLSEYLQPRALDHVTDGVLAKRDPKDIIADVWPLLQPSGHATLDQLRSNAVVRALWRQLAPRLRDALRRRLPGADEEQVVESRTISGDRRQYRFYAGFLNSIVDLGSQDTGSRVARLMDAMNRFENVDTKLAG